MKAMRPSLGAVIALAATVGCGSNGGKANGEAGADSGSGESSSAQDAADDGAGATVPDSGALDGMAPTDGGEGGSKKMRQSDGASGSPFVCGAQTCDPATQYCEYANSNIGGTTTVSCVSFDGGCSPASCSCLGLQAAASAPGQCGCYESGGEVSYGFCPP
jgi:hypothetical protein